MKRKMILLGTIMLSTTFILGGCGNKTLTSAGGDSDITEITFSHWGGDETYEGCYKDRIEKFEEENPDIKVSVITVADDYDTKLQTMIAGKQAPDVMQVAENGIGFATKNAFVDLTDKIKDEGIESASLWGAATEQYTYNDQIFGLPDRGGSTIVYYNKDMFDEAGIPYPNDNWTLNDYYTAIEKLTKDTDGDGKTDQWGSTATDYQAVWGYVLEANGGSIIKDDKVAINSAENLDSITKYNEAYENGWIVPYEELEMSGSGGDNFFAQGKVAINQTGFWCINSYSKVDDLNFDIATVPSGTQEAGWPMGSALTISKQANEEKQEAAWKFIKYMTSNEAQEILGQSMADCPANLQILNDDKFINQEVNGKKLDLSIIGTSQSRVIVDQVIREPYYSEVISEASAQVKEMLLGRLTPKECLKTLESNIQTIINNY